VFLAIVKFGDHLLKMEFIFDSNVTNFTPNQLVRQFLNFETFLVSGHVFLLRTFVETDMCL